MGWWKKDHRGDLIGGDLRVVGPGFELVDRTDPPADGWEWQDTRADAAAAFGVETSAPVPSADPVAAALVKALASLTPTSPLGTVRTALLGLRATLETM